MVLCRGPGFAYAVKPVVRASFCFVVFSDPDLSFVITLVEFLAEFIGLNFVSARNNHLVLSRFIIDHNEIAASGSLHADLPRVFWNHLLGHCANSCVPERHA